MGDPRLNSMHLEAPRREQFRQLRQILLAARGAYTVVAEKSVDDSSLDRPKTAINRSVGPPELAECWLLDKDFVYPLHVGLNTVGRSPDNDVVIQDGYVSRRHCAILVHSRQGVELHDIASKNGTFVNGKKLAGPMSLRPGDEIRMCDRQLVFMVRGHQPDNNGHTLSVDD